MKRTLFVEHSVLLATLTCEATKPDRFRVSTRMPGPIEEHSYEGSWHQVADAGYERVAEQYLADAADQPRAFGLAAADAAETLLRNARALANWQQDLVNGWEVYKESVLRAAAIAVAAQVLRIPPDLGPGPGASREVVESRHEVDDAYRLAKDILEVPEAAKVFRNTAPAVTLANLGSGSGIPAKILSHIEAYGWLRTRAYRLPPPTPTEVVDRLQNMVLRWTDADLDSMISEPSEPAGERLLRRVLTGHALLQAECIARPFFARLAGHLGCTLEQVLFSAGDELTEALKGSAPLPQAAAARRYGEGYAVYRSGDTIEVHTAGPRPFQHSLILLKGLTACRGRVVGPVRIVRDVPDLGRLRTGDVLVSPASTTDWAAGPTVFPTRGGGPAAVSRAAAVVTDEGGLLSHAAVVCREKGIPAVLGTERATELLRDGMIVELEATRQTASVIALDPASPDGGLLD
ncbi:MAG TPA: PEP-utilizing enzyme [Actinomycetota bacterium]|nr:PEP-utilizing enzyme [Actinomycetota bacterium]